MTEKLTVYSPYDLSPITEVELASTGQVESALQIAHDTFCGKNGTLRPYERISILERLANLMEENKEALVQTALKEGGKPFSDTVIEVDRAIQGVKLGVIALHNLKGEQIPMDLTPSSQARLAFSIREPIGVVCSLSAFNHPLNLIIHQTIPALVAGCPVIIKPALTTPLSCLGFVKLLYEAGLPKPWCQVVICENEQAEQLVVDSRTAFLSFIGSAKVGWYLRSKLAPGTRCGLEHGGAAPVIIDRTAVIEEFIPSLVKGGFYHSGQVCVSVQRVFVPNDMLASVSEALVAQVKTLTVGDPSDEGTDLGPLILPREVDRVSTWINEAKSSGAEIAFGGEKLSETCHQPTILVNPPVDAKVSTSEIFGPVICLYGYDDIGDAINRANALPFGFQASVFSNDLNRSIDISKKLNATAVMINDHSAFRVDWMPFAGRNQSGLGVGGIEQSVHEVTREKMIVINGLPLG